MDSMMGRSYHLYFFKCPMWMPGGTAWPGTFLKHVCLRSRDSLPGATFLLDRGTCWLGSRGRNLSVKKCNIQSKKDKNGHDLYNQTADKMEVWHSRAYVSCIMWSV